MMATRNFLRLLSIFLSLSGTVYSQSSYSPGKEALRLFNQYKPTIEKKNNALVDEPKLIVGDINGDGKDDCIVYFVMTSKDGGNMIVGSEAAIYLNTGTGMKVVGSFPHFDYCYYVDEIKSQVIIGQEYFCAPPYDSIIGTRRFVFKDGKIKELSK